MQWRLLEIPDDREGYLLAMRLNALGSLYFFSKFVLKRNRLGELHKIICKAVEKDKLHLVLEMPRDHLKTTLITESLSMWWALPFNERDEAAMRALGYDDAWIRWMKRSHDMNTRTLIVTENETNSKKFGMRIDAHYFSNDLYRALFSEIIPDESSTWNSESKHQKRSFSGQGEGTYDFLGVGGAVQSRHYNRIIEDDLVGRDARSSEIVMDSTIEYHRLLAGVFDTDTASSSGDEVVVGNRWTPWDLPNWIRDNEREFAIESHGALGGCCKLHPAGIPIFPEEFSRERLETLRNRLGSYDFSHQFLNLPVMPEECPFKQEWLKYFSFEEATDDKKALVVRHEVKEGETIADTRVGFLKRAMIVDPNHAGEYGRARHAIVVVGLDDSSDRLYLLDVWAKSLSYEELISNIYKMADKWRMRDYYLETIAAQKYLKFYLDDRERREPRHLTCRELKMDKSKNAKQNRIEALGPIFEQGKFWARQEQYDFLDEYRTYPSCRTRDVLDCLGYALNVFDYAHAQGVISYAKVMNSRRSENIHTGY